VRSATPQQACKAVTGSVDSPFSRYGGARLFGNLTCLSCLVQSPAYVLEYEQRRFRRDLHVRFHTSDPESEQIRTYLWPALLEGANGPCVHKAVVIT